MCSVYEPLQQTCQTKSDIATPTIFKTNTIYSHYKLCGAIKCVNVLDVKS